ncbi:MAG TPA: trypsin-like peptidase domain-containing protein [Xanthobacteraceae bacterium]|jgi:serine protease Do|nr:trypsin-like peptidase domain-containing protein [Xanthobacteraceae bacterium]
MRADPGEQACHCAGRRRTVLTAFVVAWVAAAGYAAGTAGSRVAQITPAVAAETRAEPTARLVGFADVVERVKPAVFSVRVETAGVEDDGDRTTGTPDPRQNKPYSVTPERAPATGEKPRVRRMGKAQGSGFFISPDGYAVTNEHVVEQGQGIEVVTDDGRTYSARLVGVDVKTDLAVIKIDGRGDFPYVRLGDGTPRIGDWVFTVGNPFGLGGTVTAGIVSARGRDIGAGPYDDFIQIDAPVNQGDSGGPTFDIDGTVIGVNTAIFSPTGGSVGIAFAVPADMVKLVVTQLRDTGVVTRGWAGLQIQAVTADIAESLGLAKAQGALVAQIEADSPAAQADIVMGDVITALNARPVRDNRDLSRKIGAMAPGTPATFAVLRNGQERTVTLTLGKLAALSPLGAAPAAPGNPADLGLTLAPARKMRGTGGQGVVVVEVKPRRGGAEHGLEMGDVILEVAGKAVNSADEVSAALADARRGGKRLVMMRVQSGPTNRFIAVPAG